jgi:hypothetical protein
VNAEDDKQQDDRMQPAQRALLVYMRRLSEENWAAGWLMDLEYTLWDRVTRRRNRSEPASEFERANLADIEVLSWLAEQAGGWWHWDEASKEPKFVPLSEWLEIYRNRPKTDLT